MRSTVLQEINGQVVILTLNRPEKFNSFNREMSLQLQDELKKAANNSEIRAILISGTGKAFCAGQDLSEAIDANGPGIDAIVREHYNPIITLIRNIEKPIVCAVNGVAAGAGANIALCCDIVLAAESALFIQAFSKIGLIPDSGGTFFLPRLIGFQRASALTMLGDKVSAAEAVSMGMIYKSVDDTLLMDTAMQISQTLANLPTNALGLTKKLLNQSLSNDLNTQLECELEEQVNAAKSYDHSEGIKAFLEKRKPVFKGQ
ncbi:MAG TPA: enoyl-CoA hydratase-related protein [Bacteroidia bacterium]|jgi:2-(1,2-epoxy-1,2-dihydrophenyl)acetyl-CoA isomerase|nr:enoyl-CoA hydratase-related protein [Bacteroidia bacterium]